MPAPEMIDCLKNPLHEEIAAVLDMHGIFDDREELEADLIFALEQLATGLGNTDEVTRGVLEKIKQLTNMNNKQAEELSRKLVGTAQEMALITKVQEKEKSYISLPKPEPLDESGKKVIKKKHFKEAMLEDIGNVFEDFPVTEEKRKLMESQLAEEYARDLGVTLKDSDAAMKAKETKTLITDITRNVDDWIATLPITINNENEKRNFDNKKKEFITKLDKLVPLGDFDEITEETKKYLQDIPLEFEMKHNDEQLSEKAEELVDKLVFIPVKTKAYQYGMSFNGLTDFIGDWLDNIHIDDRTKGEEEMKNMKKDIVNNLVHKIGEMNVDPEIFNDDSLYEDVLREELHNLLGDLTITDSNFQAMKESLIEKVKEAQARAHDEIAGQTYKQNLRDTISKVLPNQQSLSQEEQTTMEIMIDQLADAFINLHYSGSNEDLKAKLKNRIASEINTFCNNYLQKHPGTPLNSQKLNRELYGALKNVPLPAENSIRYEVEQVRIRDEINDWVRSLPLEPQSPAALLGRNKMIYVLSRKLFDIETEADDTKNIPLMRKEISKFLKKMPLRPGEEGNVPQFTDKLIEKLKATEVCRKFSEHSIVNIDGQGNISRPAGGGTRGALGSAPRLGIPGGIPRATITSDLPRTTIFSDGTTTGSIDDPMCPYYQSLLDKQKAHEQQCHKQPQSFPPCTLSPDDMAHLERIRQRTCLSPRCITSLLNKRNAGVGPRPVDVGSQTELRPESFGVGKPIHSPVCPVINRQVPRPCPGVPVSSSRQSYQERRTIPSSVPPTDSRGEVQPHIIIKEYYWDAVENPNIQEQELLQPTTFPYQEAGGGPQQQQPSPVPQQQPDTGFNQQPGADFQQQPISGFQQQPTSLPQQQQGPQRIPCDHVFPCPGSKPQPPPQQYWSPTYLPQDRSSHASISCPRTPYPRSSCTPSPCRSPLSPPLANHQSIPTSSPGFSFRHNNCRMPKRDGLQDPPCSSNRPFRKERVIELGSLDDLCSPRPKKRNNNNNFDWSYAKFPEEDGFWGTPCMRRVILDEGIDEPLLMEREKREERVRCKCKERLVPKFGRTNSRTCNQHNMFGSHGSPSSFTEDANHLNRCSKCCGLHCPYPSYLYFRQ